MPKAVLDSTVLVSAFLPRAGVSRQFLHYADQRCEPGPCGGWSAEEKGHSWLWLSLSSHLRHMLMTSCLVLQVMPYLLARFRLHFRSAAAVKRAAPRINRLTVPAHSDILSTGSRRRANAPITNLEAKTSRTETAEIANAGRINHLMIQSYVGSGWPSLRVTAVNPPCDVLSRLQAIR